MPSFKPSRLNVVFISLYQEFYKDYFIKIILSIIKKETDVSGRLICSINIIFCKNKVKNISKELSLK